METVLRNALIVTAGEMVAGSLRINESAIQSVDPGSASKGVDLEGDLLVPGLVELHTDNFERHLMPRPKVRWPELPALFAHDAEVAAAGITTVYDALGVGDIDANAMRGQSLGPVLDALAHASAAGLLRAEHRLHIRLELPAPNTRELFEPFAGHPAVGLLSLMVHTPGQRQWTNIGQARVYYCGKKGWSDEKFERSVRVGNSEMTTPSECACSTWRASVSSWLARGIPPAPEHATKWRRLAPAYRSPRRRA